jgi:hypothetical protein
VREKETNSKNKRGMSCISIEAKRITKDHYEKFMLILIRLKK